MKATAKEIKKILESPVAKIETFYITECILGDMKPSKNWNAVFQLQCGQRFFVQGSELGYFYKPILQNNRLPQIKEISWERPKEIYFGNRGCGLNTKVQLVAGSSDQDKKNYLNILTPTEIDEGCWRPYPRYRHVPMLETAFQIHGAYLNRKKVAHKMRMAEQNLMDVLALQKPRFDLERE